MATKTDFYRETGGTRNEVKNADAGSRQRKEEGVWKCYQPEPRLSIFCELQVKKPACRFSHYLENMHRNQAVWIQRRIQRLQILFFKQLNKKQTHNWVRDLANGWEI